MMGFSSPCKVHLTRCGVTINYETSPDEEVARFRSMNFKFEKQVPMVKRVGFMNYRPAVAIYYVFSKV